jgi:formylglycine-generating enzyme required for sulfatase activity
LRWETFVWLSICPALLVGFLLVASSAPALAAKRVALVIGVDDYQSIGDLGNPVNDATAMAALFEKSGITVILRTNPTFVDFHDALAELEAAGADAEEVIVYYAGHGFALDRGDVLAPADLEFDCDRRTAKRFIKLDDLFERLGSVPRKVVLLDACRNDPFPTCPKRGSTGTGFRGLTLLGRDTSGTLIASSTLSGALAADGPDGGHSPFASALLKHLSEKPHTLFRDVLDLAAADVAALTGKAQIPEIITRGGAPPSCLAGVNCGGPADATAATPPAETTPAAPRAEDAEIWPTIEDTASCGVLESFIKRFPDSTYADFARARQKELGCGEEKVALAAPAVPKTAGSCDDILVKVGTGEDCLKPGDVFRDIEAGPEMVVVPAGKFTMGSPESEEDRNSNEGPQHEVTIGRPFAVGKLEVTRGQFAAFVEATGHTTGESCYAFADGAWKDTLGRSWRDPGYEQTGDHPVVCVSWADAKAYVAWLAKATGKDYRLLSEAEWEYAARGETEPGAYPRFHFGSAIQLCDYDNGADTSTSFDWWNTSCNVGRGQGTAVAGRYKPNAFGLHDMHGNVWEWTEDCYHGSYSGAPTDGLAWTTGSCDDRVQRGGGWFISLGFLRAAARNGASPVGRAVESGFRVARTLAP